MSKLRDEAIDEVIRIEGGYVKDPQDSGGATKFGVTEYVARNYGYTGPMHAMSRVFAVAVYQDKYWHKLELDNIEHLSPLIAEEMIEAGVNIGTQRTAEYLQRCLNVLNLNATAYADLAVDGAVGPNTLQALRAYLDRRGEEGDRVLFRMLNCLQGNHYITLAERRSKDEKFVFGWFRNRVA